MKFRAVESKVSQRGSVVIPKLIRQALNVKDGDYIQWFINESVTVKKKEKVK